MAKYTSVVTLSTNAWTEVSSGTKDTVLITMDRNQRMDVEFALADAAADLNNDTDAGHMLTQTDYPSQGWYGILGKKVCAKKRAAGNCRIIMTEF